MNSWVVDLWQTYDKLRSNLGFFVNRAAEPFCHPTDKSTKEINRNVTANIHTWQRGWSVRPCVVHTAKRRQLLLSLLLLLFWAWNADWIRVLVTNNGNVVVTVVSRHRCCTYWCSRQWMVLVLLQHCWRRGWWICTLCRGRRRSHHSQLIWRRHASRGLHTLQLHRHNQSTPQLYHSTTTREQENKHNLTTLLSTVFKMNQNQAELNCLT